MPHIKIQKSAVQKLAEHCILQNFPQPEYTFTSIAYCAGVSYVCVVQVGECEGFGNSSPKEVAQERAAEHLLYKLNKGNFENSMPDFSVLYEDDEDFDSSEVSCNGFYCKKRTREG